MADMLRGARLLLARLKPVKVPEAPARSFRDLWPGDAQRGARLLRGELEVAGSARPFTGWASAGGPLQWRAAAHGFAWLRDLRRSAPMPPASAPATSPRTGWCAARATRWPTPRRWRPPASPPGSAIGSSSRPPRRTAGAAS
jgi:uncharacterized heparinase superfamily protein